MSSDHPTPSGSSPEMRLETERLLIRPWRREEAPRVLDIQSRLEVIKWLGDDEPEPMRTLEEARERIETYHRRSTCPPRGYWAVEVKETGAVAGSVLLLTLPDAEHEEVEIGWHLHPDSWGHGYASEAAAAVLDFGFAGGLPEIYALTHLDNRPSHAVCRRIGLRELGVVERWYKGPSRLFGLTLPEYAER